MNILSKPNKEGYWFLWYDCDNSWDVVLVTEDLMHFFTYGDDYKCTIDEDNNRWIKVVMPILAE